MVFGSELGGWGGCRGVTVAVFVCRGGDFVASVKMKRISKWKIGGEVVASQMDSCLAHREMVASKVGVARMEDQADLDKKYTAEV